jgi:hypothetical protein
MGFLLGISAYTNEFNDILLSVDNEKKPINTENYENYEATHEQ